MKKSTKTTSANPRAISELTATNIVDERLSEKRAGNISTLDQFTERMNSSDQILDPKVDAKLSRSSMYRLLTGKMFPNLRDFDDNPIDWSSVPTGRGTQERRVPSMRSRLDAMEKKVAELAAMVERLGGAR